MARPDREAAEGGQGPGRGAGAELNIALFSPHGMAWFTAPLPVVAQWLERTYRLMPAGQESDALDLDAELSRLLHGTELR